MCALSILNQTIGAVYVSSFLGVIIIAGTVVGGIFVFNYFAPKYGFRPLSITLFQSPSRGPRGRGGKDWLRPGSKGDAIKGAGGGKPVKEHSFQTIDSADGYVNKRGTPQGASPSRNGKGSGSKKSERFGTPQREDSYRTTSSSGSRGVKSAQKHSSSTPRTKFQREDSARFHLNQIRQGGYFTNKQRGHEYV